MSARTELVLAHFLRNIELWLSGIGVVVILLAPWLMAPAPARYWKVVAATAIVIGVLHGLIFWLVRRRQRRIRGILIARVRAMLQDEINNRLQLVIAHATASERSAMTTESLTEVRRSVREITSLLDGLTSERLRAWESYYGLDRDDAALRQIDVRSIGNPGA